MMQDTPFGIYLHWPFCQAKCPYCDFNSHVSAKVDQNQWFKAFESEIDRLHEQTPERRVTSIYFGGGTPSLMLPQTVEAILNRIRLRWSLANDVEVTLEANPTSVEADRFRGYQAAGVNRISLGFQAMNDADLRALGRIHDHAAALRALDVARNAFDRVTFDLIYARQNQTLADWERELKQALDLQPDHISLYQLTIEDGTAFALRHQAGGLAGLPDEDLSVDLYHLTQDLCEAAGLPAYEVSNHARVGRESKHNLTYWRGSDYLGIGPGAHGRMSLNSGRWATAHEKAPQAWLQRVTEKGNGEVERTSLRPTESADEFLLMGLRLREGLDLDRLKRLYSAEIGKTTVMDLSDLGLLVATGDRITATRSGFLVLNAVIRELATTMVHSQNYSGA